MAMLALIALPCAVYACLSWGLLAPPRLCSKTVRRTASNGAGGGSLLTMPGLTAFNATHEADRRQQLEVSKPSLSLLPLRCACAFSSRGVALVTF